MIGRNRAGWYRETICEPIATNNRREMKRRENSRRSCHDKIEPLFADAPAIIGAGVSVGAHVDIAGIA